MAQLSYTHCRQCGEQLDNRTDPYCPPCNLYLAYRAMPILLGMLLTGPPASVKAQPAGKFTSHTPHDLSNIFPCRKQLCGVSPSVTALCECTGHER